MPDEVIHTIDYHVSVDLYDRTVKSSMYCRSNDTANRIYLTLHRGGEIYDVHDDVFAQVLYYRDGEESEHESPIVRIAYPYHGRVIIDVPAGVINEPGEVNVRVKLYSNQFGTAEIVSTPIWRIVIPDDAYFDEGIPPAESQSGYDYVVSTWNAAIVATADATNAAAEARAAEDERVLAEGQRVNAENQRRLAELGRIAAEAIRQQSYTDKIPTAEKGEANGVAPLDGNELIPEEYIPMYALTEAELAEILV